MLFVFVFMYRSLYPGKRRDGGDLTLKLCLILREIIFKLPFQNFFVFMLVEMATFGRKKKRSKTALLFALHEKASVSEDF